MPPAGSMENWNTAPAAGGAGSAVAGDSERPYPKAEPAPHERSKEGLALATVRILMFVVVSPTHSWPLPFAAAAKPRGF